MHAGLLIPLQQNKSLYLPLAALLSSIITITLPASLPGRDETGFPNVYIPNTWRLQQHRYESNQKKMKNIMIIQPPKQPDFFPPFWSSSWSYHRIAGGAVTQKNREEEKQGWNTYSFTHTHTHTHVIIYTTQVLHRNQHNFPFCIQSPIYKTFTLNPTNTIILITATDCHSIYITERLLEPRWNLRWKSLKYT